MNPQQKEMLEKIASMKLANYPQSQIAEAIGVDDSRVSQLMEKESFKQVYQELSSKKFGLHNELDNSWDDIENKSLDIIKQHLSFSNDADYALRAAAVANKSQRRTSASNTPLPVGEGLRAVVELPINFIQQINNTQINIQQQAGETTPDLKEHDFLTAEAVHDHLGVTDPDPVEQITRDLPQLED